MHRLFIQNIYLVTIAQTFGTVKLDYLEMCISIYSVRNKALGVTLYNLREDLPRAYNIQVRSHWVSRRIYLGRIKLIKPIKPLRAFVIMNETV